MFAAAAADGPALLALPVSAGLQSLGWATRLYLVDSPWKGRHGRFPLEKNLLRRCWRCPSLRNNAANRRAPVSTLTMFSECGQMPYAQVDGKADQT